MTKEERNPLINPIVFDVVVCVYTNDPNYDYNKRTVQAVIGNLVAFTQYKDSKIYWVTTDDWCKSSSLNSYEWKVLHRGDD